MTRTLFGIAASTSQYQKAIDYGKQMVDAGHRQRRTTSRSSRRAITSRRTARTRSSGRTRRSPPRARPARRRRRIVYLFKLQCASDAGDTAAMDAGADGSHPAHQQDDLLEHAAAHRAPGRAGRPQHADDLPHHVQHQFDERGHATTSRWRSCWAMPRCRARRRRCSRRRCPAGVIKDEHKERTKRLLTSLKTRADADRKGLAQEDAEAAKSAGRRARREARRGVLRLRRLSEGGRLPSTAACRRARSSIWTRRTSISAWRRRS